MSIMLGSGEGIYIHLLVLEAFAGLAPPGARGRRVDITSDPADPRLHLWEWRRAKRKDLSDTIITEIKHRFAAGGIAQRQLAAEYNLTPSFVSMLIRGKIGTVVDGPTGTPDVVRGLLPPPEALRMLRTGDDPRMLIRDGVEVWKPVPTLEDRYYISNQGRVLFVPWWRLLRTVREHTYTGLILSVGDSTTVKILLHRLMLVAFDGVPPVQFDRFGLPVMMDARHLDDIPTHNTLDNLAWGTRSENLDDLARNGRMARGSDHHRASAALTEADVATALQQFAAIPTTLADFAALLGVSTSTARPILVGEAWTHVPRPSGFEAIIARVFPAGRSQRRFTAQECVDIRHRLRAGEGASSIARTYNTSPQAIEYHRE